MAEPPTRSPALYRGAPGLTSAPRAHAGDTAVRPPLKARPCPTRDSEGKPFPRRSPSWERRKERVPPWRHSRPQVAWDRGHRARPRRCPRVPAGGDSAGTGVRGDGAKRMEWGCVRGGGSAHVGMFPLWGRVGSPKAFGGVGERWDTAGSPRPQGDEKAGAGRARAELCGPSESPVQQEGAVRADGGPWAGENPPWVRAAAAWGAGPWGARPPAWGQPLARDTGTRSQGPGSHPSPMGDTGPTASPTQRTSWPPQEPTCPRPHSSSDVPSAQQRPKTQPSHQRCPSPVPTLTPPPLGAPSRAHPHRGRQWRCPPVRCPPVPSRVPFPSSPPGLRVAAGPRAAGGHPGAARLVQPEPHPGPRVPNPFRDESGPSRSTQGLVGARVPAGTRPSLGLSYSSWHGRIRHTGTWRSSAQPHKSHPQLSERPQRCHSPRTRRPGVEDSGAGWARAAGWGGSRDVGQRDTVPRREPLSPGCHAGIPAPWGAPH